MREILSSENLVLKQTLVNEYASLFPIFSNEEVVRYTNFKKCDDENSLKAFLDKFLAIGKGETLQYGPYTVYYNDIAIGLCGVQQIDRENGVSELWYILHKDYWGKGLAKKSVELLMSECKSNKQLKTIHAEALSKNPASWKILERFGFVQTGEVKNGFVKGDVKEDLRQYKMDLMI